MRLRKNFGSCEVDPKKYEPPLVKYFALYAIQVCDSFQRFYILRISFMVYSGFLFSYLLKFNSRCENAKVRLVRRTIYLLISKLIFFEPKGYCLFANPHKGDYNYFSKFHSSSCNVKALLSPQGAYIISDTPEGTLKRFNIQFYEGEGEVALSSAKRWDRRNGADLIESAAPCHDAQVMGPYRDLSPLRLTVLAAMSDDYTTAPQHLQCMSQIHKFDKVFIPNHIKINMQSYFAE